MSIGFRPSNNTRQPVFGEQVSRRVGYVEHDKRGIFFCDADGKRIARVLRYKPHQAPQPSRDLVSGYVPRSDFSGGNGGVCDRLQMPPKPVLLRLNTKHDYSRSCND